MATGPSYTKQLVGSLIAAILIVVLAIALVTAKIGPGLDSQELHDLGLDDAYEQDEQDEQDDDDNSGPGR